MALQTKEGKIGMYCNQCGARLEEGAKFCSECGAVIAQAAAPGGQGAAGPQDAYPPQQGAYVPPQQGARPVQQQVSGQPQRTFDPPQGTYAPQQGAYVPSQQGARPAQQQALGQPQRTSGQPQRTYPSQPGAYPPPQGARPVQQAPGRPQGAYPYSGQAANAGAAVKPKKKHTGLIVALVIFGLLVASFIGLMIMVALRHEEPPLNELSQTETEKVTVAEAETTTEPAGEEEEETSADPDSDRNMLLTDAQAKAVMEKTVGFWSSPDLKRFIGVSRMEGGLYYFTTGNWYSEMDVVGYLQQPVNGDPDGVVSVHLYFEGYEGEDGYVIPAADTDMLFDMSGAADGVIKWNLYGEWEEYRYAGATMDEAIPPYEQLFDVAQ